jgi:hypothetical protein
MSERLFPGFEIPQAIDDDAGEAALWLVMTERDAKDIVAATENGSAYQVIEILKHQPWWTEICAAVRKLRHLKAEPAVAQLSGN